MNYPFNDRDNSLTKKDQGAIDKFFATGTEIDKVHVGPDGSKRKIIFWKFPRGAVTPWTNWGPVIDGKKWYLTTYAISDGKVVELLYLNLDTDEKTSCTGAEWMKWLGGKASLESDAPREQTPEDKVTASKIRAQAGGGMKHLGAAEYDALDGGNQGWRSPTSNK